MVPDIETSDFDRGLTVDLGKPNSWTLRCLCSSCLRKRRT